jgi:hypothetical protein
MGPIAQNLQVAAHEQIGESAHVAVNESNFDCNMYARNKTRANFAEIIKLNGGF